MNIFAVDNDPEVAARMLCDKHVCKMIIESAQLLCSIYSNDSAPYKRTHYHHPAAKWARTSWENYLWLFNHAEALSREFKYRYGHEHASTVAINWCNAQAPWKIEFPQTGLTEFVQCMPEIYKVPGNPIQAYRNYYIYDKSRFAAWNRGRPAPEWFLTGVTNVLQHKN